MWILLKGTVHSSQFPTWKIELFETTAPVYPNIEQIQSTLTDRKFNKKDSLDKTMESRRIKTPQLFKEFWS